VENPDPQPVRAWTGEPHKSTYVISANTLSLFLILSPNLQVGRDELGRPQDSAVLVVSCLSLLRRVLAVVEQMCRLPAE
jgi:hypothetical protein